MDPQEVVIDLEHRNFRISSNRREREVEACEQLLTLEHDPLDEALRHQLGAYLEVVVRLNDRRGYERKRHDAERERKLLDFTFTHLITSRDERIEQILSPAVQEIIAKKQGLFPFGTPRLIICIDGRIFPLLFAGLHGNAYRTPAGDSRQFVPSAEDGRIFLLEGSDVARMIDDAINKNYKNNHISEVLDSHVGCAARYGEQQHYHRTTNEGDIADGGLRADVMRKRDMADAMQAYVRRKYGSAKQLSTIQTSYDVHSGFLYMGLEKDECLYHDRAREFDSTTQIPRGFTPDLLKQLTDEGRIISTKQLLGEPLGIGGTLQELFASSGFSFNLDYETNYVSSTVTFWNNLEQMKDIALPMIRRKVTQVFTELADSAAAADVDQRSLLLLANTYTAYLLNRRKYGYGTHVEMAVELNDSCKGPHKSIRSFVIDAGTPGLNQHIAFSQDLIRDNRFAGQMSAQEQAYLGRLYPDSYDLKRAPTPLITYGRLCQYPSEAEIQSLQSIDWSVIATLPWLTMSAEHFQAFLREQWELPEYVEGAIERLRQQAVKLHNSPLQNDLFNGDTVPLFVLSTPKRRALALLPFVIAGVPRVPMNQVAQSLGDIHEQLELPYVNPQDDETPS